MEALSKVRDEHTLHSQVRELLGEPTFRVDGLKRKQIESRLLAAVSTAQDVRSAAFDWDVPEALDDAHRTLFALYADRIWRPPVERRSDYAQRALGEIRNELEIGFRHQLGKRRMHAEADFTPHIGELAQWFEDLALAEHPLESPSWGPFIREFAPLEAMKSIVAQRSLFFLREPDPWIYAVPTLSGVAKAGLIDLLLDEYGWGKYEHMHSTVYAHVMEALELETRIDHYESEASWQYLATLNHQWMYALEPEFSRRLLGVVYLTEADSPGAMTNYLAAWDRLGVTDERVLKFYDLHVHADENHRDVALHEVVMPVAEAGGPAAAREIAIGIWDGRALEAEFADHILSVHGPSVRA